METETPNDDVTEVGSNENWIFDPAVRTLEGVVAVLIVKSEINASVLPDDPTASIVHVIAVPTRAGFVLEHDNVDAVLGTG